MMSTVLLIAIVSSVGMDQYMNAQSTGLFNPLSNSIPTPRPFDPGQNSTNPSAFAVQTQNPFLGSVHLIPFTPGVLALSIKDAVADGLRANLGYIDSEQDHTQARAARIRALSALLPQLSAESTQTYRNLVSDSLGVDKLGFPHLVPPFNYQTANLSYRQDVIDVQALHEIRSSNEEVNASSAAVADARNVVVLAAVSSYLLAVASKVRVHTAKSQFITAAATDQLLQDRVTSEVSPSIDGIRAHVAMLSARQRLVVAEATLEKDKLALTRIIGLSSDQQFELSDDLSYLPSPKRSMNELLVKIYAERQDIKAAEARRQAAQEHVAAQKAERLPTLDVEAAGGEAGATYGHAFGDYTVAAKVSIPLFTGRRIESQSMAAEAVLHRREAELDDVRARAVYDVRTASLDLQTSESGVEVALENMSLAQEGLRQARDRYDAGVSNTVDLIQAQEAVANAEDNKTATVYANALAKLMLIRATGTAQSEYAAYLGVR